MKALLLAAGEGKRLRPLTSNTPKSLLFIAGKPFLAHTVESLVKCGVRDIFILIGWKSMKIRDYFGDGSQFGADITYIEQSSPKGTGDAVLCAEEYLDESFICINGDVIVSENDVCGIINSFEKKKCSIMGIAEVSDPASYGSVSEKDGILVDIKEKSNEPLSNRINAGIFVFTKDIFKFIRSSKTSIRGELEITDAVCSMNKEMPVHTYNLSDNWMDIGTPQDLLDANILLLSAKLQEIKGTVEQGAVLKGNVFVEEGALIRSGSYIEGPVYISSGCDIGPNCYIRPYTSLAPNVRIGASVELKNSIILSNSHIPHHNYVGDSIIGENCNLGAGTKVANLRFDKKNVKTYAGDTNADSGRRKLGVIMGDSVNTGINSMIDAGTVIFENSIIGPGAFVSGKVAPGSRVF